MKANLEKITIGQEASLVYKKFHFAELCDAPYWHYHPEYELVYVHNGAGRRQIGKHISYYENGDLLLLGPGLPHMPFSNQQFADNFEIVIQFAPRFVTGNFSTLPEFQKIRDLFDRSRHGIAFHQPVRRALMPDLLEMNNLEGFSRLWLVLKVLHQLAVTQDYELLGVEELILEKYDRDYDRINQVYSFVARNFAQEVQLAEVAAICNLSTNSFCRFFKKVTAKRFFTFLNEYRIQKASELLVQTDQTVAYIASVCGFNDLSYFSRQFKRFKDMSPTRFRANYRLRSRSSSINRM